MAAVHREDKPHVQTWVFLFKGRYGFEGDGDVLLSSELRRFSGSGSQFRIHYAIFQEISEHRIGCIPNRLLIDEEVVYVAAEEGEESTFPVGHSGDNQDKQGRRAGEGYSRFQVEIMLSLGHNNQRVLEVSCI